MKKTYITPSIQMHSIATNQCLLAGSTGSATNNISGSLNEEETTTPGARPSGSGLWD